MNYAMATELDKKSEAILVRMWEEVCDIFFMFTHWAEEGDAAKIEPVLIKFSQ